MKEFRKYTKSKSN